MKREAPVFAVGKSCSANWDKMRGDDERRFCEHCQKYVHNISAISKKQRALFGRSDEQQCIFYFQGRMEKSRTFHWLRCFDGGSLFFASPPAGQL